MWSIVHNLIRPFPSTQKAWAQAMRLKEEAKEAAKSGRKNDAEELFKQATQWADDLSSPKRRALALSAVARAQMSSDRIAGLQVFERALLTADRIGLSDRSQYLGTIALDLAMAGEGQRARDLLKGHDAQYFSRIATEQAKAGDFAEALKTVSTMPMRVGIRDDTPEWIAIRQAQAGDLRAANETLALAKAQG
jgi:hypothetical protein